MADRQSQTHSHVSPVHGTDEQEQRVRFVAERIRAAMKRKGWEDEGKPDIRRLASEAGVRWQTAQRWVLGTNRELPKQENLERIAEVLGMTLEQLIGAATGEEPRSDAWTRFCASELGRSMTASERQALAAMLWPNGDPDEAAYRMALSTIRSV